MEMAGDEGIETRRQHDVVHSDPFSIGRPFGRDALPTT
jgi:hypothetical protein